MDKPIRTISWTNALCALVMKDVRHTNMFWPKKHKISPDEQARRDKMDAAKAIRDFIYGTGGKWDWDDFVSVTCDTPEVNEIRHFCATADLHFPPTKPHHYCSEEGIEEMKKILEKLEMEIKTTEPADSSKGLSAPG